MNLNRISRRCVGEYIKARRQGKTSAVITTRVEDVNALAIAIKARAPNLVVYYECLSNRVKLEQVTSS